MTAPFEALHGSEGEGYFEFGNSDFASDKSEFICAQISVAGTRIATSKAS